MCSRTRCSATIVVGCAPQELHDLGVMFASLFLVRRGWHVVYLGAQVPLADLLETIRKVKPKLVCLSASTLETAMNLLEVARAVQQEFPHVHFGYGGRIFNVNPELCAAIPGAFLGAMRVNWCKQSVQSCQATVHPFLLNARNVL